MVTWAVAYSSGSTKSSRITLARGVCQERLSLELTDSSISRETAAAAKDLVVEAVKNRLSGVTGSFGNLAIP